jgi:hypothetical protein
MFDQLFDGFRKASESSVVAQHEILRQWLPQRAPASPRTNGHVLKRTGSFPKSWVPSSAKTKPSTDHVATETSKPESNPIYDLKATRELWLWQLGEFMDQYLRSPAFLAWLLFSLTLENARLNWFGKPFTQPPAPPQKKISEEASADD